MPDFTTFWTTCQRQESQLGIPEKKRSYYLQGSDHSRAVVCVHGFTASPEETLPIATTINQSLNLPVFGARMTGHGTSAEDLATTPSSAWIKSVDLVVDAFHSLTDEVVVLGISTGALVGLDLASRGKISALICDSVYLKSKNWGVQLLSRAPKLVKLLANLQGKSQLPSEIRPGREGLTYSTNPVDAVVSLFQFRNRLIPQLNQVTCPLLITHTTDDTVAHPRSAPFLASRVQSTKKMIHWYKGGHAGIYQPYPQTYETILSFLTSLTP